MSTESPDRKVQHIETLGRASADVELYGQQLRDALAQVYWAAQNGDAQKMKSAYQDATEHASAMRKTLLSATEAMDALIGEPEPALGKFRDLVSRVEKGVREEENGTLEIPEPDEHESAWKSIFRMSGFADLLALAEYARTTIETESIAEPEAIDDVRFCQRLSDDLFEAHTSIKDRNWSAAFFELQGAMADLSVYRKAVDDRDKYHPELELAEHMFNEIDRIEQYVHTQRLASEVQS